MKVVVGAEESTAVSDAIVRHVRHLGHDVIPISDGLGWAEVGLGVARAVSSAAESADWIHAGSVVGAVAGG